MVTVGQVVGRKWPRGCKDQFQTESGKRKKRSYSKEKVGRSKSCEKVQTSYGKEGQDTIKYDNV